MGAARRADLLVVAKNPIIANNLAGEFLYGIGDVRADHAT
jgi:hypothetical protein